METLGHLHLCLLNEQEKVPEIGIKPMRSFTALALAGASTLTGIQSAHATGWDCDCYDEISPALHDSEFLPHVLPPFGVLRLGDRGEAVYQLQVQLNVLLRGEGRIAEDGIFGPETLELVLLFQEYAEIPCDGVVGPGTISILEEEVASGFEEEAGVFSYGGRGSFKRFLAGRRGGGVRLARR